LLSEMALFVALRSRNLLEVAVKSPDDFIELVSRYSLHPAHAL
jgi:hypothetical protein